MGVTMPKPKQESIRELALEGNSQRKISKLLHVARNTVSKYVNADLDPRPAPKAAPKSPTMEPWADLVDEWLTQDLSMPKKQRHKATTVFERLRALGFRGSYSTVQRYVRHWRQEHPEPLARRGYLELEWAPGIAQADFGSAVVEIDGKRVDAHVLVLTFPHANARFCVGLPAERAECLCEGLLLIFEHIGGVPTPSSSTTRARREGVWAISSGRARSSPRFANRSASWRASPTPTPATRRARWKTPSAT